MSPRHRGGRTDPQPWGDWQRHPPSDRLIAETGWDADSIEVWSNGRYQVYVRQIGTPFGPTLGPMVHLSIKRNDRNTIRDWRHLQRIKNELVGPECEGVELYPAESRLVDAANQYHLWVFTDPENRYPFGATEREVGGPSDAAQVGAVQRPFEEA